MSFDQAERQSARPVRTMRAAVRADLRPGPRPADGEDIPAPQLARRILIVVVCSYVFTGILDIQADNPGTAGHIGSYTCMALVFALQIGHLSRSAPHWPLKYRIMTLSAQSFLTYLPFFVFDQLWGGMAGLLAGSFLILLRRPLAWAFFWVVAGSMAILAVNTHEPPAWVAYFVVSTYLLGLIIYGLSRLVGLVGQLQEARSDLARMAVAQERLRFARDLHDLLGYSLSSISLKSELTYRLVPVQPELARRELASILDVARQALADVRAVASSYRLLRLADEVESVKSVLQAAAVDVHVDFSRTDLPHALDTVLATVLREGATNILRHSKAQHCTIVCKAQNGTVQLELANDGVDENDSADLDPDENAGSGLDNLGSRMRGVGGTLTAGVGKDGWFRLVAEAPMVHRKQQPVARDDWEDALEEQGAA